MFDELKEQFERLAAIEFEDPLTDEQDTLLCLLESIIGGSYLEMIIDCPEDIDDIVNEMINGKEYPDDPYSTIEPTEYDTLIETIEAIKNFFPS